MPEPARRGKRGPAPNPDRGTQSGYRVTARQRFELGMAQQFLGATSLQDTIQIAVDRLLVQMKEVDGFQAAVEAAERHQQDRNAVARLPDNRQAT